MYYKEQYVFKGEEISKAVIRNYGEADFEALINIQRECFPPPFPDELLWNREQLSSHLAPVSYTHLTLPTICSV